MCTRNTLHGSHHSNGVCTAYGCDGRPEPCGCMGVLLVIAMVAGLLGLGGYVAVDQAVAATSSEVR